MMEHRPVLLNECVDNLLTKLGGVYIDGTFGRGGHSRELLKSLDDSAKLFVYDKDLEAIKCAQDLAQKDPRVAVRHGSFSLIPQDAIKWGIWGKISGIMLDLGVSSPQLDDSERGFSFNEDGPLDMRMDTTQGLSAKDWLKSVKEVELESIIRNYGEEKFSKRIARDIVKVRDAEEISTTGKLAAIIENAVPQKNSKRHPATRSFQAIRIHINQELFALDHLLDNIIEGLAEGGRIAIIGFHSIEHNAVKRFAKHYLPGNEDDFSKHPPKVPRLRRIGRAIFPSAQEVSGNRRARSAVLRVLEKIA
ncbi:MAG TPA: 16S rRNA (cytosine(1402)-N(4))-methyltransferase RsmH [Gammaproteobacteria bacterium]|nr:16S rRNA (cytosine(1402)-N(4))-methyltransferase RsmH [Gammaproteobacteria bacterium]